MKNDNEWLRQEKYKLQIENRSLKATISGLKERSPDKFEADERYKQEISKMKKKQWVSQLS